jgi:hypothetical protein
VHHAPFLPQQAVLRLLFLHQDMVQEQHQPLLPFIHHPGGRLKAGGNGFEK